LNASTWANVLFSLVVLAPVAGLLFATVVAADRSEPWITAGCITTATGAIVLLIAGQHPDVGRMQPDELALAATAATALLALKLPPVRGPVVAGVVTLAAVYAGMRIPKEVNGTAVAVAIVFVAAAASVTGAWVAPRLAALVVPAAALLGLRAAPRIEASSAGRWLALALAVGAVVLACGARSVGCAALMPWVFVAALAPVAGSATAARALAAGAILALLFGDRRATLAVAPGVAVLVYALADADGRWRVAFAVLLLATAAGLARDAPAPPTPLLRHPVDGAALLLMAWLVVRPESWTWLHIDGLGAYTDGVTLAAATSLVVLLLGTLRTPLAGRFHAR